MHFKSVRKTVTRVFNNIARYVVKFWLGLNFLQTLLKLLFEANFVIGVEGSQLQNQFFRQIGPTAPLCCVP